MGMWPTQGTGNPDKVDANAGDFRLPLGEASHGEALSLPNKG